MQHEEAGRSVPARAVGSVLLCPECLDFYGSGYGAGLAAGYAQGLIEGKLARLTADDRIEAAARRFYALQADEAHNKALAKSAAAWIDVERARSGVT